MATPTIDVSFVEEFEAGVHLAYQRKGSKLRNTIRTKNGVKNKTTFQKVGKGSASQKARHGDIPPMNLDHTNVNVTLQDWFAGEWVDDLDMLRINHDELQVAMDSGAYALGRKTDELLLDAMETGNTNTIDETTNGFTKAYAQSVFESLGNNDVPDDGQRYGVIGFENWSQALNVSEFVNMDFVGPDQLPYRNGMTAKRWLSVLWFPHSGLTTSNDDNHCFVYHYTSTGHAIGEDVSSNMQYYNTKDSWFVQNKMQMNAVLIDQIGCIFSKLKQ